jgi:hypothetical protein
MTRAARRATPRRDLEPQGDTSGARAPASLRGAAVRRPAGRLTATPPSWRARTPGAHLRALQRLALLVPLLAPLLVHIDFVGLRLARQPLRLARLLALAAARLTAPLRPVCAVLQGWGWGVGGRGGK